MKQITGTVEDIRQDGSRQTCRNAKKSIPEILRQTGDRDVAGYLEQGLKPGKMPVNAVGHHRAEQSVQQGAPFKLHVAVQYLDSEYRRADGRPKDRRKAGRHPDKH